MKAFEKKYNGKCIEDAGCYMSKEATSFCRCFKNMLRRILPDDVKVEKFNIGHYYLSTFLVCGDKILYLSYNLPRYSQVNFDATCCSEAVLYRSAQSTKDYTGGHNRFCSIRELQTVLPRYFQEVN